MSSPAADEEPVKAEDLAALPWAEPQGPAHGSAGVFIVAVAGLGLAAVVVAGSVHGGLKSNLKTEYWNIARALAAGEGFAHPFQQPTGPTAWMTPVLPLLLCALFIVGGGSVAFVSTAVVVLQTAVLIGTAVLVLALAKQTGRRLGVGTAAAHGYSVVALWKLIVSKRRQRSR